MSDDNVIDFVSKSELRRLSVETGHNDGDITDEEFAIFLEAFLGEYKGGVHSE